MSVSAPGKLMLLGEYAVVDGGLAVVAAVNRRAVGVVLTEPDPSPSPVVQAVLTRAQAEGAVLPPGIRIDTSAFRDADGAKLGLGSSAAVAVIAAALATGRGDDDVLRIAVDGHRAAAHGKGSGVDVAACFSGGVVATRAQPGPIQPLPRGIRGLTPSVLYTGVSASTPHMLAACQASPRWDDWMAVMRPLVRRGIKAWIAQEALPFLRVIAEYGRAMAGLGADAGVPVVTEQIEAMMRLAAEAGGAAKPSGAGGGDVVVMWSADPEAAQRVADATQSVVVDLAVDPRGLSRRG